MVQFHPTALDCGADPMPLLTEALRGAGCRLVDERGRPLLAGPNAELQPRDVVARGIWSALAEGRRAHLDAREAIGAAFPQRFPTVFAALREHGLDPRREPIPVAPAAHYHMGGIVTDLDGRTSVSGLWAAGETACTGVHGANRLASNSLLEALVFGARVARSVAEALPALHRSAATTAPAAIARPNGHDAGPLQSELRELMWQNAGLVRTAEGLGRALARLRQMGRELPAGAHELRSLHTVARLVATAALARRESRGAHFRADHPSSSPAWRRHIVLAAAGEEVRLSTVEPTRRAAAVATAEASA
jgi:L-aspartate oxidase